MLDAADAESESTGTDHIGARGGGARLRVGGIDRGTAAGRERRGRRGSFRDLLRTEISQYATKLGTAATRYEETDGAAADVLNKFAGPVRYYTA